VILDALSNPADPGVRDAFEALQWLFRLLPHYSLSYGIYTISADARLAPDLRVGALSMTPDGAGWCVAYLFCTAPLYFALCLIFEYWTETKAAFGRLACMRGRQTRANAARIAYLESVLSHDEDPDVEEERLRVVHLERQIIAHLRGAHPAGDAAHARNGDEGASDYDADVEEAGLRVLSRHVAAENSTDAVLLSGVSKVFGSAPRACCPSARRRGHFTAAVADLSFGVAHGTAFGFCGINGAGKTTGFRILTGEIPPTRGQVYVRDFEASTRPGDPSYLRLDRDAARIRQNLGYCPQSDPLVGTMTGLEHLHLFAALRGVHPGRPRQLEVQRLVHGLAMHRYVGRPASGYSGGQKRALSVAIALVGRPPLVLMDEPSAGMDPLASRRLWTSLTDLVSPVSPDGDDAQRLPPAPALLLTSHSMLESEALCGRIGIMIGGRLRCLGSPQHLKERFGTGYVLELQVAPSGGSGAGRPGALVDAIVSRIPTAKVLQDAPAAGGILRVALGRSRSALRAAFDAARSAPGVTDFVVSQSSLDEVFDALARQGLSVASDAASA